MLVNMTYLANPRSIHFLKAHAVYHFSIGISNIACGLHNADEPLMETANEVRDMFPDRYTIYRIDSPTFSCSLQTQWVNMLVGEINRNFNSTYIINSDDDEFYVGPLMEVLSQCDAEGINQVYTDGYTFWETVRDDKTNKCPAIYMTYRENEGRRYSNKKVIFKPKGFRTTTDGNHWVVLDGVERRIKDVDGIFIYHFSNRQKHYGPYSAVSEEQITQKGLIQDTTVRDILKGLPL